MAFPQVVATQEYSGPTSSSTHTIPFTQTTGNLVVIVMGNAGNVSIDSLSDGFVENGVTTNPIHCLLKALDGSEGGDVLVTFSTAQKVAAIAYNITGYDTTTLVDSQGNFGGPDTNPDPPSLHPFPETEDFLWIAGFRQAGEEADDDTWCTAAPTNYTDLVQVTSGTGGSVASNCSTAAARRELLNTTEDPGTFTVAQSLVWHAITIAVHPGSGGGAPAARVPKFKPYPQLLAH